MEARTLRRMALWAVTLCLGAAAPAEPWIGRVTWTSYLHAGPGRHYAVTDEINTATRVQVLSCAADWCHVVVDGAGGYLAQAVLAPVTNEAPKAAPDMSCFEARRAGYGPGKVFDYCPK